MKRKDKRKTRDRDSFHPALNTHRKKGTKLVPPIKQIEGLKDIPWLRDVFPDMLWICSLLAPDPNMTFLPAVRFLEIITQAAAPHLPKESGLPAIVTGTLTNLESFPETARRAVLQTLLERDSYDSAVSEDFAHALGVYPTAPGCWLLDPWRDRGQSSDRKRAQTYLNGLVEAASNGTSPLAVAAKHLFIRGFLLANRLQFAEEVTTAKLLPLYPQSLSLDERAQVDVIASACFLCLLKLHEKSGQSSRVEWAKKFWRSNWTIYPCWSLSGLQQGDDAAQSSLEQAMANHRKFLESIEDAFHSTAMKADPDLYQPDRYEILTGIVARVLRLVRCTLESPMFWGEEYGASILRSVIESKIVFQWLLLKDDEELYSKFKDYGRGHLKLFALHFRDYVHSADNPPEEFRIQSDHLTASINDDISEAFQDIIIDRTFASKSIREMAIEVGLKRDYDLLYSPSSSEFHGEWKALDRHALDKCGNPLHRGHRIPHRRGTLIFGTHLIELLVGEASRMVEHYATVTMPPSSVSTQKHV